MLHEAGHALVALTVPNGEPVHKISIIPRGVAALGYTLQLPVAEKFLSTRNELKDQIGSGIVAVADAYDGKGSIVVGVTPDLVSKISSVDLVRIGVTEMGGKGGGGRPDMAQGGGPDPTKVDAALAAIEADMKEKLTA